MAYLESQDFFGSFEIAEQLGLDEYKDIPLCRVANRGSRPSDDGVRSSVYKSLRNAKSWAEAKSASPGLVAYESLFTSTALQGFAKEGDNYNWLEALAAVEAHRIGVIAMPMVAPERTVGGADVYDARKRPFDVKTPSPVNVFSGKAKTNPQKFSTSHTIHNRLTGKGGYDGYPAILLLDVAWLSDGDLATLRGKYLKYAAGGKHVVEKRKTPMELWRIIEVCPAYFGPQLATYTKTPQ